MKRRIVQASAAVEVIAQNLNNLPHPDHGRLRLTYFGHQSEGQTKITRGTAEAIVLLLESNGFHVVNLAEAATLLESHGWTVEAPPVPLGNPPGNPSGNPPADPWDVPPGLSRWDSTPVEVDDAGNVYPIFSEVDA